VEGGKEMNDLLFGVIIGGLIGLVSSAIQGYYSLKGKREDNLAREHQQSMQVQHEKDSQVLSRRIARRMLYLEPLSGHLSSLYTSICDYVDKLISILSPYYKDKEREEIQVRGVDKEKFRKRLLELNSTLAEIETVGRGLVKLTGQIGDLKLIKNLTVLYDSLTAFAESNTAMRKSLRNSTKEQDFVYDFEEIMKSTRKSRIDISDAQERIESLLAGIEEGRE
jgi:gas vesicle protein